MLFTNPRHNELSVAAAVSVAMAVLILVVTQLSNANRAQIAGVEAGEPIAVFPDFASVESIDVKKQQFFDYLEDYIIAENIRISRDRAQLEPYVEIANSGAEFSDREREWILELADYYRVETEGLSDRAIANELFLRVDEIPVSLALAQAANESAWGTSRFALQGNNIFGEWCFNEGCGIVPRRRASGASHEVQTFESIAESIASYFLNINTNNSYQYLRELRADMRKRGQDLDPMVLAMGLGRYSQRGDHYVDEVQNIILQNDLRNRDKS
jgi:Bax protein